LVLVRTRDSKDHLSWLLERARYAEALQALDDMQKRGETRDFGPDLDVPAIGQKYITHLVGEGRTLSSTGSILTDTYLR
jgi:vacuolar protein sorting-associated protein 41